MHSCSSHMTFVLELDGRDAVENAQLDMLAELISDALNADGIKQWPYVLLGVINEDKVEGFPRAH